MNRQIYDRKNQQKTSSATTLDWGVPQVRPFITQLKMRYAKRQASGLSHKPDLKTSLNQAETYGHHLGKIQLASVSDGTPIQMLSATDEEDKQMSGVLEVSKLTDNKEVLHRVLLVENQLKKLNNNHKKDSTGIINPIETSTSKNKDKEKSDVRSTSPAAHQVSENKATEDNSPTQDPEVTRLLNKASKNNLPGLDKVTQDQENIAPSTYNQDKNTPPPKAGTSSQLLAKKAAMHLLENNQEFTTTQRAVEKVPLKDAKAKDNQHQVKLKNAAELVRDQVIKDDRQVKEHLRGNFNLDPEIVAKEGGEELILQKVQ
ncbi:hypothetical protein IQ247_20765 [Plectonema cf. radiosum LEGE 06105]|uniref:Uncharacterized protein n=1 Tax=Plectonema cf. radiosum LEGE 06105 TaxID=945769 RepID=A0A8J7FJP4_9CYAN|nr:hypothetical protein [Plectonema radiosum]MBE9215066.1 hypothetical protein [Plectonema cf. radiosum LEGE 06105]